MRHVFISYKREDISYAEDLAAKLKLAGIEIWWDEGDISGGDDWADELDKALRQSYAIVVTDVTQPTGSAAKNLKSEMRTVRHWYKVWL